MKLYYYHLLLFINLFPYNYMMAQTNNTGQDTVRYLYPTGEGKYLDVYPAVRPLRNADFLPAVLKETPAQNVSSGSSQPYINTEQNSRSNNIVTKTQLDIEWKSPVRQGFTPFFILTIDNNIIVQSGVLQLFNSDGSLLNSMKNGFGPVIFETDHTMYYYIDPYGRLTGCNSNNGSKIFDSKLLFGEKYRQILMILKDQSITIVGNERQLDPQHRVNAKQSLVTTLSLADIYNAKSSREKNYAKETGSIVINSEKVIAAACGNDIVLAYPGRMMIVDIDLKIKAAYEGSFKPLAISGDESERIYLLNDNEKGRCLWIITKDGERLYAADIPNAIAHPPIVGFDHRVFIPCKKNIAVIEQDGKQKMNYALNHSFNGAIVTADDKLLVCDGPQLISFDKSGNSTVLYDFGSDSLCTPPVITEDGKILVASKQYLYCLEPK